LKTIEANVALVARIRSSEAVGNATGADIAAAAAFVDVGDNDVDPAVAVKRVASMAGRIGARPGAVVDALGLLPTMTTATTLQHSKIGDEHNKSMLREHCVCFHARHSAAGAAGAAASGGAATGGA
jgi:hypothetical protein